LVQFWFNSWRARSKLANSQDFSPFAAVCTNVTSLSHDPFTGDVYASLSNLDVVRVSPFAETVDPFQKMPGKGRVAVSPSGKLWFTPVKYINNLPLSSWQLPMSF
jgi:hypothetical protein